MFILAFFMKLGESEREREKEEGQTNPSDMRLIPTPKYAGCLPPASCAGVSLSQACIAKIMAVLIHLVLFSLFSFSL